MAPRARAADGLLVVLVPGLGLDARAWRLVWPLLAGPCTVLTLPSMGRPAARRSDLSVEGQAERLGAVLPAGNTLVLVGHSASCPVVVETAARHSSVVGLVLVGPVTDPAAATWPRMLGQWGRTAGHERPWEVGVLAPQYRRTGVSSMARGMEHVRRYRTDVALSALTLPVRIVRGEHDRIAPQGWCADLAAAADGSVTTVPGAAHMVPLTHPHAVVGAVDAIRGPAPPR